MGKRQHDPDKERIFVRPITGAYSLTDELKRLRSMPRVIKGKETKLDGGPQHFSRHTPGPNGPRAKLKRLRSMPRVTKGKETKLDGGPKLFPRHYVEPEDG